MNFRKSLAKKLKKTGGFTLVEMLIVVAIIAILIAISIPMVTSNLEKARTATDDANERSAKAAALLKYMDRAPSGGSGSAADTVIYCYDADNGVAGEFTTGGAHTYLGTGYGQGSIDPNGTGTTRRNGHIHVTITAGSADISNDGTDVEWIPSGG